MATTAGTIIDVDDSKGDPAAASDGMLPGSTVPSDRFANNAEGYARAGAAALGIGAGLGAAVVGALTPLTHHGGGLARTSAAAAVGLLAAAVLMPGDVPAEHPASPLRYVLSNLTTMGKAIDANVHAREAARPNATVASAAPLSTDRTPVVTRPTARQVLDAHLPHVPGHVDETTAHADAAAALRQVDWRKRDIVVWVPGTDDHEMPHNWLRPAQAAFGDRASQVFMDYPASWDLAPSAATGMETLKLTLAGIAQHGGDHRIFLAGHSQGAWVIGDTMANPVIHGMVTRAILFGDPGVARQRYTDRTDPKVTEVDDPGDPNTFPVRAAGSFLAADHAFENGNTVSAIANVLVPGLANPVGAVYYAGKLTDPGRWSGLRDPHHYQTEFPAGATWLATGTAPREAPGRTPAELGATEH